MEKMKIMVVDDNTVNLATLEQELKDKYEVIPMMTGRRAIKYLYQNKVDLILLDVQMPIMDGIETLKEIRTQDNGVVVPVIFLTARKDANTVLEGSKLGIMDYVTKPFDPDDLKERIERVFKRLGVLPMEVDELYNRISEIDKDLTEGRLKPAITKTEEVLRYQLQEELAGRVHNAKAKMQAGNVEAAQALIQRVASIIGKELGNANKSVNMPINQAEISARLLYILDDLENFRLNDAKDKLTEFRNYELDEDILLTIETAHTALREFDDIEAENVIRGMLEKLKKNNRPVLNSGSAPGAGMTSGASASVSSGKSSSSSGSSTNEGYRSTRLR